MQPFHGWRIPPDEIFGFLLAPWPRYVTMGDVMLNVVAYLPLGIVLYFVMRPRLPPVAAFFVAATEAAALSLAMESAQMFLPARIASNVDLLANTTGAALGAFAACALALSTPGGGPFNALRHRAIRSGPLGDGGLIVLALWIAIQFHPAPLALSMGDVREWLQIAPAFKHTGQSYLLAETAVVALGMLAAGLLVSLLASPAQSVWPAILVAMSIALGVKSAASMAFSKAVNALQWLTPGAALGIAVGAALLTLGLRTPLKARAVIAALCIMGSVLLVNLTPENPYYNVPSAMLNPQPTHLVNLTHIVRTLSLIWPLLALGYLALLARSQKGALR